MSKTEIVLNNLTVFTGNSLPIWDMGIKDLDLGACLYVSAYRTKNFPDYGGGIFKLDVNKYQELLDLIPLISKKSETSLGIQFLKPILESLLTATKEHIVVIEYPELCLSPAEISKLTAFICERVSLGYKVILETYSDHIINGLRIASKEPKIDSELISIYFFEEEKITLIKPDIAGKLLKIEGDKVRTTNLPQGFFDEYANSMFKLFNI